ncbi:hypothetical protein FACS189485_19420 [Spirochaetia bacterium]|nr:hypothetical protein FACS189485_19420 [Spirochaetia bacterium]
MKISLWDASRGNYVSESCEAAETETVLSALARSGFALSAPCGGRGICGKCRMRLVTGTIRGDTPDGAGVFLACRAVPLTDITIAPVFDEGFVENEVSASAAAGKGPGLKMKKAGAAIDIGTTTISAQLVDLDTSAIVDTFSELNNQRAFGADVMSRIQAAVTGKTAELFNLVNKQTKKILDTFIEKYQLEKIETLSVSGNTTMLHLFLNTDPSGMGQIPFSPVFLEERELAGSVLGIPAEWVILLPGISAFIGGDIVSGLAFLDILNSGKTAMLIDIGTNGEIALFKGAELFCCSAAAGPAFEGAEISCGIGSVRGAINRIEDAGGKLSYTTIGNAPPLGICGSGLIDAIALMLKAGFIDGGGAFCDDASAGFAIAEGISLVNRDVRQFQLAKSAILSGIKILCKNAGLRPADIDCVYIAGGLGFFIDKQNAVTAGLLPEEFLGKIAVCGNLSLKGAVQCLLDTAFLPKCRRIIEKSRVMDLAADPLFMDAFAENMLFIPD